MFVVSSSRIGLFSFTPFSIDPEPLLYRSYWTATVQYDGQHVTFENPITVLGRIGRQLHVWQHVTFEIPMASSHDARVASVPYTKTWHDLVEKPKQISTGMLLGQWTLYVPRHAEPHTSSNLPHPLAREEGC